ncbi:hypothetical protein GEV33_015463 [Tenebrio molitor]|uniref:Uncharacterized protein n=1 Tax=Tenebrio molitor TaxID=7067 RepID=A0A8J6L0H8_TENMO|nr:hypothetical protein GEV33_015467 [Tenebrio molitor]KAH0807328.1 hypothetical protein GEV33_015463 [Tenebrio molitor]
MWNVNKLSLTSLPVVPTPRLVLSCHKRNPRPPPLPIGQPARTQKRRYIPRKDLKSFAESLRPERGENERLKQKATTQAGAQAALKARELERLKEELDGAASLGDLGESLEREWSEEAFLRTRVRRENPMDSTSAANKDGERMWKAGAANPKLWEIVGEVV